MYLSATPSIVYSSVHFIKLARAFAAYRLLQLVQLTCQLLGNVKQLSVRKVIVIQLQYGILPCRGWLLSNNINGSTVDVLIRK